MRSSCLALALLANPLLAADHVVGPGQSIQAAIDASVDGDRVLVQPGTYAESFLFKGKAIEVIGTGGAGVTTLQGASGPVVAFWHGETASSVLQGFTVTGGGNSSYGGGVSCFEGYGSPGGFASPTVLDCRITGNTAFSGGGGVAGQPRLVRCVIEGNSCAPGDGGGVWGGAQLESCVVANNTTLDGWGGGVAMKVGGPYIVDSVVVGNLSDESARGGGVYVDALVSSALIQDSLIAGNEATYPMGIGRGAGIYSESAATVVRRCTIVGNLSESFFGSGVGGFEGQGTLTSCIVRDNSQPNVQGASASFCDVLGGYSGAGNFDAEPLFVAAGSDYHLRPGSPCIGAGLGGEGVGAFGSRMLYTRANVTQSHWADPSWPSISLGVGGKQELHTYFDTDHAGELYIMLGSLSGSAPGFQLNGLQVDLNVDAYTLFLLSGASPGLLFNAVGFFDGQGRSTASVSVPAGSPAALAGLGASYVAISFDPSSFVASAVSEVETTSFVP